MEYLGFLKDIGFTDEVIEEIESYWRNYYPEDESGGIEYLQSWSHSYDRWGLDDRQTELKKTISLLRALGVTEHDIVGELCDRLGVLKEMDTDDIIERLHHYNIPKFLKDYFHLIDRSVFYDDFFRFGCDFAPLNIEKKRDVGALGSYSYKLICGDYNKTPYESRILFTAVNTELMNILLPSPYVETITIPAGIQRIGEHAVVDLIRIDYEGLECGKLILPASLETIEPEAFVDITIHSIVLDNQNKHFVLDNECLYTKDKKKLILVPSSKNTRYNEETVKYINGTGILSISEGTEEVQKGAAYGIYSIKKLELPESLVDFEELKGLLDSLKSYTDIAVYAVPDSPVAKYCLEHDIKYIPKMSQKEKEEQDLIQAYHSSSKSYEEIMAFLNESEKEDTIKGKNIRDKNAEIASLEMGWLKEANVSDETILEFEKQYHNSNTHEIVDDISRNYVEALKNINYLKSIGIEPIDEIILTFPDVLLLSSKELMKKFEKFSIPDIVKDINEDCCAAFEDVIYG